MITFLKKLFYKYIGKNEEFYLWYLINMILHPQTVYETTKYQFSLTQQWHRRDHSITKIIVLINLIFALLFAFTFVHPLYILPYIFFNEKSWKI